jgi:hypothetical protein
VLKGSERCCQVIYVMICIEKSEKVGLGL